MITSLDGGGAENSTLTNCTLMGNQADGGGGGGADSSTLNNCLVTDNSASFGGGVENSTLNNCTLTGNSASAVDNYGGAQQSTLNNCIVYYNTNGDYGWFSSLSYCCTAQLPDGGIGNITNEPGFVNFASTRLSSSKSLAVILRAAAALAAFARSFHKIAAQPSGLMTE